MYIVDTQGALCLGLDEERDWYAYFYVSHALRHAQLIVHSGLYRSKFYRHVYVQLVFHSY